MFHNPVTIITLRHIRHILDTPTASLIAHSLVSSRFDYANSHTVLLNQLSSNFSQLRILWLVLSLSLITHSEPYFTSFWSTVAFDSSWQPLLTKPYPLHLPHTWPLIFIFISLLVYSDQLINNFWISPIHLLKLSLAPDPSAALRLLFGTQFLSKFHLAHLIMIPLNTVLKTHLFRHHPA